MDKSGVVWAGPFVRRNFVLNVLDGALYSLAMSLVSRSTVLPVFIKQAGGDNVAVGVLPVLWIVGFNLPQIFIANYTQQVASKKRLILKTALLQRLPWLLLAVFTYVWAEAVTPDLVLWVFFAGFGMAAVAGSMNLPPWFDLVAKVTPVRLRGRLFAARTLIGATLGLVGGFVSERVLETMGYPVSFALLFALAFGVMIVSYVFLALLKEGEAAPPVRRVRYRAFLRGLPAILKGAPNYRNFLVAQALLLMALTIEAFFTVDAFERFDLSAGYAGRFTMVIMGSMIIGTPVFGVLADRYGHRINLVVGGLSMTAACVVALLAPTVEVYAFAFVGAAFAVSLRQISELSFIAEVCGEADRPTYIALSNLLTSPFVLAGIGAGWLADRFGYDIIFILAGVVAALAALWLATVVHEPRNASTH